LALVPQHTPLAVILAPPLVVTLPPDVAVVCVIVETGAVVIVGTVARVVKIKSLPYAVPALFVA